MSQRDVKVYERAMEVIYGRLSVMELSLLIGKSYRQARRIVKKVRAQGPKGVKHGNTGRTPQNKICDDLKSEIIRLLKGKYYNFNLCHFREMIAKNEGIKIKNSTLHRIAVKNGLVKRPKRRKKRVHHPRPRMPQEGLLVQFDGSEHRWFGNFESDLIGGIDDASGRVLWAEFFIGETSLHCMKVMKEIVSRNGVPKSFYLDQAGYFGKDDRDQCSTQIGRALEELNSQVILASTPQAKGRIERLWGTFQDRLIAELALAGIKTMPRANEYLQKVFLPDYNQRFSVETRDPSSAFTALDPMIDLNQIFCTKYERKVGNANIFNWGGQRYVVTENRSHRFRRIHVCQHLDGTTTYEIHGRLVRVQKYQARREYARKAA